MRYIAKIKNVRVTSVEAPDEDAARALVRSSLGRPGRWDIWKQWVNAGMVVVAEDQEQAARDNAIMAERHKPVDPDADPLDRLFS